MIKMFTPPKKIAKITIISTHILIEFLIILLQTGMSFCYVVEKKLSFNRFLYRSIVQI